MELIQHHCKNCGGDLTPVGADKMKCVFCGSVFDTVSAEKNTKQMQELFDDAKREMVNNLRRNLYNATHADYISSAEIHSVCTSLKKYLPDDFQANFYDIAAGSNVRQLTRAIRDINTEEHYEDLDGIVEYLIRSMQVEFLLELNNLVERAYKQRDLTKFEHYSTAISDEAQKVQMGIYETKLPREVFVAYSSKDMDKVSELVDELESQGMKCFVAARNLRHGKGAVENYDRALKEAMDHCRSFVFVSSRNSRSISCDALEIEIPYVQKKDIENAPAEYRNNYASIPHKYKKPRVEYRIEESLGANAADVITNEFFDGYERVYSPKEVANRIMKQLLHAPEEDIPQGAAAGGAKKYCAKCGTENGLSTKFCSQCGNTQFFNSVAEYIQATNRQQEALRRKAEKAQQEAEQAQREAEQAQREAKTRATSVGSGAYAAVSPRSEKNHWIALVLCLLLGSFGVHRFYAGKKKSGIVYLCTLGILGFGPIVDLIRILKGSFKDDSGRALAFPREGKKRTVASVIGSFVVAYMVFLIFILVIVIIVGAAVGSIINGEDPGDGYYGDYTGDLNNGYNDGYNDDYNDDYNGGENSSFADGAVYVEGGLKYTMASGGWSAAVADGSTAEISGELVIPDQIKGAPVVAIPEGAFKNCAGLTSVIVPDSVKLIVEGSFSGCSGLTSMTVPFVGGNAAASGKEGLFGFIFGSKEYNGGVKINQLYNNTQSVDYYLPMQLTKVTVTKTSQLSAYAFMNCAMLTDITLCEGIINVGEGAFQNCVMLNTVELPSVTAIGNYTFKNCVYLSSFDINDRVTSIGNEAFKGCIELRSLGSDTEGEFVIPDSVQTIGSGAFNGCTKIKSISLPFVGQSRSAKDNASLFGYIFGIEKYTGGVEITQDPDGDNWNSFGFFIPSQLRTVTITDAIQISNYAFENCAGFNTIKINDDVVNVGVGAFKGCSALTEISLPAVLEISDKLFMDCTSLTGCILNDRITKIGVSAFQGCTKLKCLYSDVDGDFYVPETVTSIGEKAFSGCTKIETLTLPFVGNSRTATGYSGLFGYIFGEVSYTGGTKTTQDPEGDSWNSKNYYIPAQLRGVVITDATQVIDYAFHNCAMLDAVTLNSSVEGAVGANAFVGCTVVPDYY